MSSKYATCLRIDLNGGDNFDAIPFKSKVEATDTGEQGNRSEVHFAANALHLLPLMYQCRQPL